MSRRPREPFDWPAFRGTFLLQPVPAWIAAALLLRPAARATPALLRATCAGPAREGVASFAYVVYAFAVPAAAAALVYLLAGRRRMTRAHRLIGDLSLALVLLVSAGNAVALASRARENWTTLRPGLLMLRAACWK